MMQTSKPTLQIPSWDLYEDHQTLSPFTSNAIDSLTALHRFLPSNQPDFPIDAFSSDHFRMYEFKVRRCARGRSHDWTDCPYAHPGEKARRRDPRKYQYSGTSCPDFRKGCCKKGDVCEFAHGVFECWLHPARYRTQPCKDGPACRRRVCFFAHTPDQLRFVLTGEKGSVFGSGSGELHPESAFGMFGFSPTSILISPPLSPSSNSPPMTPVSGIDGFDSSELVGSMRALNIRDSTNMGVSWRFGSPRGSVLRPRISSLPTSPTGGMGGSGIWDFEEETPMERVESGRDLRAKIYAKLSKENCLERNEMSGSGPDLGWISELIK